MLKAHSLVCNPWPHALWTNYQLGRWCLCSSLPDLELKKITSTHSLLLRLSLTLLFPYKMVENWQQRDLCSAHKHASACNHRHELATLSEELEQSYTLERNMGDFPLGYLCNGIIEIRTSEREIYVIVILAALFTSVQYFKLCWNLNFHLFG